MRLRLRSTIQLSENASGCNDAFLRTGYSLTDRFHSQSRVVVVGAGLVGLLLAIVLRRADYHVVVVDKDGELKEVRPA